MKDLQQFILEKILINKNSKIGYIYHPITKDELKFPLKLVFDKGTQLTIFSKEDLNSVRLLMTGEHEIEKELAISHSYPLLLKAYSSPLQIL